MVIKTLREDAPMTVGVVAKELTGFDLPDAGLARQITKSSAIAGMHALTKLATECAVGLSGDAVQGDYELLTHVVDLLTRQRRQGGGVSGEHPLKVRNHQK
ncbi:MAG: hypothetical protein LH606_18250 [Cytophagaceae bacterium]|nr:hypothetical protein [Cytophagaceae bacterium]